MEGYGSNAQLSPSLGWISRVLFNNVLSAVDESFVTRPNSGLFMFGQSIIVPYDSVLLCDNGHAIAKL